MAQTAASPNRSGKSSQLNDTLKNNKGFSVGCLVLILLFTAIGMYFMLMISSQVPNDMTEVVQDINRYHQKFGIWPKSLEELKSKLPDYQFEHPYSYYHNKDMFMVSWQGSGLGGDDLGDFYRSDTKEWKSIYSNRKEFLSLEDKLPYSP